MAELTLLNNRYQIEGQLGGGGMAIVYRARDLMLERMVAVKILREDYSADPAFRERFRQEAKAVANLSHPSIVTIHDFGWDEGKLFIVMEYVPGTDLKTILQSRGRFSVDEAVPLIIQACAGVGYAHRAGLVHCDIKPQNMLVTPDQRLKVTDFGIARALASISPEEKANIIWGSPQYFAPEQAMGGPPSPASDVYSLGVVLYEMITGRLPFTAANATELSRLHRTALPQPPRQIVPAIPPALETIILKVLAKEPSMRYRTADQLGRVLMSFNRATTVTAAPATARTPSPSATARRQRSVTASAPQAAPPPAAPVQQSLPAQPPRQSPPRINQPQPQYQPAPTPPQPVPNYQPQQNPLDIDWATWGMALLAVIAVLGLIPLWTWVYLLWSK